MLLLGAIIATVVLTFVVLNPWIESDDDLCSGKHTLHCSDGVVRVAGVALRILLALGVLSVTAIRPAR